MAEQATEAAGTVTGQLAIQKIYLTEDLQVFY